MKGRVKFDNCLSKNTDIEFIKSPTCIIINIGNKSFNDSNLIELYSTLSLEDTYEFNQLYKVALHRLSDKQLPMFEFIEPSKQGRGFYSASVTSQNGSMFNTYNIELQLSLDGNILVRNTTLNKLVQIRSNGIIYEAVLSGLLERK